MLNNFLFLQLLIIKIKIDAPRKFKEYSFEGIDIIGIIEDIIKLIVKGIL